MIEKLKKIVEKAAKIWRKIEEDILKIKNLILFDEDLISSTSWRPHQFVEVFIIILVTSSLNRDFFR